MLVQTTTEAYTILPQKKDIPHCRPGEVLIKIMRVGICGSDMQIYHGQHQYVDFPLVQGHEGCGVVEATGEGVSSVKQGDPVAIFPLDYCGTCYACRQNRHNICVDLKFIGVKQDGFFSEYFLTKEKNVIKIPLGMSFDTAAFIEPTAVGMAAAIRANATVGKSIAIIGGGPIGNLTAQACRALGADVLLTDLVQSKLDFATSKKIPFAVNTGTVSLEAAIKSSFKKGFADVIIDCVGMETTLSQAIAASANGSCILVVGNFKKPYPLELPLLQRREVDLTGLFLYTEEAFEKSIKFLYDGSINIDGMVTARFPLSDLQKAFQWIDKNPADVIKVMIDVHR